MSTMPLQTRRNDETGKVEVLIAGEWVDFEEYRDKQIAAAYSNSIRFLRDRLGEDIREQENVSDENQP